MVRPRGGRASPRYHHIKEAAEAQFLAAIAKNERIKKRKPKTSKIKQSIYRLHIIGNAIDNELERIRKYLKGKK
jgi:hypothetical protein